MSSIIINTLLINNRDLEAPIITIKLGGITLTRFLLDARASINILSKEVIDHNHVGVTTFPYRIMLSR